MIGISSNMSHPSRTVSEHAIRIVPMLGVIGFILVVVGGMTVRPMVLRVGTCLFLGGAVLWAFANGGLFIKALIDLLRQDGVRSFIRHPWSSFMLLLLTGFFLWTGATFVRFVLRAASAVK